MFDGTVEEFYGLKVDEVFIGGAALFRVTAKDESTIGMNDAFSLNDKLFSFKGELFGDEANSTTDDYKYMYNYPDHLSMPRPFQPRTPMTRAQCDAQVKLELVHNYTTATEFVVEIIQGTLAKYSSIVFIQGLSDRHEACLQGCEKIEQAAQGVRVLLLRLQQAVILA